VPIKCRLLGLHGYKSTEDAAWGLTFPPPSGQLSHTVAGLEGARLQAFGLGDDHAEPARVPSDRTALVIKSWNQIIEHLEKWREFAIDLAASDSPQETEIECIQENFTYEPIKLEDGWQRPQVSY
jgi:hypothetical protein